MKSKQILIILFIIITFSGCNNDLPKVQGKAGENINKINLIDQEIEDEYREIIEVIINSINDDLWFFGDSSIFKGYENNTVQIDVFKDPDDDNFIYILFKSVNSNQSEYYYAGYFKGYNGYSNNWGTNISDKSYDNLKKRVEEYGDILCYTTIIEVGEVKEPNYPIYDESRKKLNEEFIEKTLEYMKKNNFVGSFKVYIINYRDNDYSMISLIEKDDGKVWFATADRQENNKPGAVLITEKRDVYRDNYLYKKIKNIAVETKEITY